MRRSTFPAGPMIIAVQVLLLSACATTVPSGEVPPGTKIPTEVAPATTTAFTGDASTPAGASPADPSPITHAAGRLAGTIWTLESMDGEPPLEGIVITLRFARDGWLAGSVADNYYSGEVTESSGALRVGPLAISPVEGMKKKLVKQQNHFIEMLQGVTRWSIEGDVLTLVRDGGEGSLVFSPQSQDLSGIMWTIESYRAGPGDMRGVLDDAATSLTFGEDGTMRGTAGCNDLFGQFTAGNGALQIGPVERTQERCSGLVGVMEQELAVIAALEDTTTYWVEGDKVQMYQDDGAGVVVLTHA